MNKEEVIKRIIEDTGLSRAEIQQLVEEKKEELNGRISDEGALFIIIKELGADLLLKESEQKIDSDQVMALKELKRLKRHFFDVKIEDGKVIEIFFWQNWVDELPESVSKFTHLERFTLTMNNLTSLPKGFTELKSLKELFISGNQFSQFPEQVLELSKLEWLDLSANSLETIPKSIKKLKNLKVLNLGYNYSLKKLPESLASLKNLENLMLDQCYDIEVPESVKSMKDLTIKGLDDLIPDETGKFNIQLLVKDFGSPAVIDYEDEEIREQLVHPNALVIKDEKISIEFRYPLSVKVFFDYERKGGFRRLDLFKCIYEGYKKIYEEEEQEVGDPGTYERLYNRRRSFGTYGIWGHYLGELYIEGISYDPDTKKVSLFIGS